MTENQKPLNLLKELRKEIDTAMSTYSEQEDRDKHARMVILHIFEKHIIVLRTRKSSISQS